MLKTWIPEEIPEKDELKNESRKQERSFTSSR